MFQLVDESLAQVLEAVPNNSAEGDVSTLEGNEVDGESPLLADVLNGEDCEEALLLTTDDKLINFRSKRLIQTFEVKRKEVRVHAAHVNIHASGSGLSRLAPVFLLA